ncbi:AAA ATPase OS=Herpetosiphon aurantiacus (strain ATCC 23779 / DSM 785) GN=Haur_4235 PE=4 SV=1 [Gemmata massiliana]|uniref:AAA ATPase n=1 Tax=Gemmata massiliana TaxID=1210884 RepID=A0A6P2CUK3_9BACT|nr:ATP-binding protein [Gemmata massiliana]VTR91825.1 AAA ATPase OS=Herpetosiphon aurantiacus (strain ATCC 23779 / DSM 785) GN=Haur_4235 PE=4 SV=1 [Gemmata massiliana]
MRFIIANEFYQQMIAMPDHTPDCYVRPGEFLHHMYIDGVKYAVAPAVIDCLAEAEAKNDQEAIAHLRLHKLHFEALLADAERTGTLTEDVTLLGDAPPTDEEAIPMTGNAYIPRVPSRWEDLGLDLPFIFDLAMRTIYNRGQITGGELANSMAVPFPIVNPVFQAMRKQSLIDIVAQRGNSGDASFVYAIKPPKGEDALRDALDKTSYVGPAPVPFTDYVESVMAQTIKRLVVTRRSIQRAFEDLIITDESFNEIGPAINSAQSIFFFGYPGNGKTSVAERITRLMGDAIYVPHAVEANGQIIKVFDPIQHTVIQDDDHHDVTETVLKRGVQFDQRFIKVKRPTIVVGGELTMPMLDLKYNTVGKYYEAPLQMKANGGIFMIDDFGRQQVRAMDLLNRWIVPLEKKYDYLNTITGTKVEVPFDQLLIFSTNLDPHQLADEAFLRRIKFKIEIRDPDEAQYRKIWELVCRSKRVEFDSRGVDYLVQKWYRPSGRPFRMCQPRDILDQMMSIAKYNMERVNFSPDLIDAACATYFISSQKKDFGAKVRME